MMNTANWICTTGLAASLVASAGLAQETPENESTYYTVEHFSAPEGAVLEVGGLDFLSDGRLVLSTRRGQVWIVDGAMGEDVDDAIFTLFAEGLNEGLGLSVVDDQIFVVQRGELSRLIDRDGDGRCDQIDTISDDWGMSGNYHEFSFGLPRDMAGNFYVGLNVGFMSPKWWHGKAAAPYRGWVMRVAPDGTTTPFACGFRSPAGMGRNAQGEIFVTDNQGDWMASSPIFHVQEGHFYGHPASLEWTEEYRSSQALASDEIPPARASERTPPAIWIPYDWSRSTGNLVVDSSGGAFGPFDGQMFVAELTNGLVLRALLEKVRGEYQGACVLFRQNIGSVCRVRFAPDGSLFTGLTNRGWGGLNPGHGLARVRHTGALPLEIHGVHLLQNGFEVRFTQPLAADCTPSPDDIDMLQYDYNYWWEYGSPEQARTTLDVQALQVSADRRTLRFTTAALTPAMVVRCRLSGLTAESGAQLLHEEFAYTINQLPEGPLTSKFVAKTVEPPPARDEDQVGWLRLSYGDALDAWHSTGWELCDAQLDPDDPTRFKTSPGVNALTNTADSDGSGPSPYISKALFGDCELSLSFMLPEGGNSGVYMMGRYEVQLCDSEGKRDPNRADCGGIGSGPEWPGSAPSHNMFKRPGTWHELVIDFRAPRFDAVGKKTEHARFVSVEIDGTQVQENVEVPHPTDGALTDKEASLGPILLQGDRGPVAYGSITLKPTAAAEGESEAGWVALFDGDDLDGWHVLGDGDWEVDGETLVGTGEAGYLVSDEAFEGDFDLRAQVKINDGGKSSLLVRAAGMDTELSGYAGQISSSFPSPEKTGSLIGLAPVRTHLIPAGTWFDYELRCRDTPDGVHLTLLINGVLINEHLDTDSAHTGGRIGLEQHHAGSVVEFRDIRIRR
ncbi:MAG: glucose/arabinose dehydrogenase [Chlamydiales bacterium]|jgi:glucose/arabinose dehydrogenase